MKTAAVATTAGVSLVLIGLLVGCGTDRSTLGPPDATFPLLVADPADQTPVGEMVDLIFEVLDEAPKESSFPPAWKPPYRVASQLVVRAHINEEFFAEGSWRNQQVTVQGVVRPLDEKTGSVPVTYSFGITTLSGPLRNQSRMRTSIHLKPHTPTQIGGSLRTAGDDEKVQTMVMWFRPHVTPGQPAPLSPQP